MFFGHGKPLVRESYHSNNLSYLAAPIKMQSSRVGPYNTVFNFNFKQPLSEVTHNYH